MNFQEFSLDFCRASKITSIMLIISMTGTNIGGNSGAGTGGVPVLFIARLCALPAATCVNSVPVGAPLCTAHSNLVPMPQ